MFIEGAFQVAEFVAEARVAKAFKCRMVGLDLLHVHVCDEAIFDKILDQIGLEFGCSGPGIHLPLFVVEHFGNSSRAFLAGHEGNSKEACGKSGNDKNHFVVLHHGSKHHLLFGAVLVVLQLEVENGRPLFQVKGHIHPAHLHQSWWQLHCCLPAVMTSSLFLCCGSPCCNLPSIGAIFATSYHSIALVCSHLCFQFVFLLQLSSHWLDAQTLQFVQHRLVWHGLMPPMAMSFHQTNF